MNLKAGRSRWAHFDRSTGNRCLDDSSIVGSELCVGNPFELYSSEGDESFPLGASRPAGQKST